MASRGNDESLGCSTLRIFGGCKVAYYINIDMSGERGAIAVPALRHSLRRSIVAHFARKVRATIASRKCFKFAIGPCFKSAIGPL